MAGYTFDFVKRSKKAIRALFDSEDQNNSSYLLYVDPSDYIPGAGSFGNSSSVLAPLITRLAISAVTQRIHHVTLTGRNGRFKNIRDSSLEHVLSIKANIDQTGMDFFLDAYITLLSNGACALVPIDTVGGDPRTGSSYDILSMRVGTIESWGSTHVDVSLYDEKVGFRRVVPVPKTYAAVVYNPLYMIMNSPNSTLSRLMDRLALMDVADARAASPGIDLIIQLPYAVKTDQRQKEAEERVKSIENQLTSSSYGVAYVGATEKVTPLNRPVNNTIQDQVRYLTELLYSQLGISPSVFTGNATEQEMLVYNTTAVQPVVNAVVNTMRSTFLTQTALSQGQDIRSFFDVFAVTPVPSLADAADKFTRNEILSPNDIRSKLGFPESDDPKADELKNRNIAEPKGSIPQPHASEEAKQTT